MRDMIDQEVDEQPFQEELKDYLFIGSLIAPIFLLAELSLDIKPSLFLFEISGVSAIVSLLILSESLIVSQFASIRKKIKNILLGK